MNINLLSPDSKIPNLAIMKLSSFHKQMGDQVELNFPLLGADMTYASVVFDWTEIPEADIVGGTGVDLCSKLDPEIESMKPDYDLYPNMSYSMGYTYRACPRNCSFCVVPKQDNSEDHHSIWDFHNERFKAICLLNNNTLADPYWRDTFDEINDAKLRIVDQNGYDVRLITEEVAYQISKLKFVNNIHIAWDYPEHEIEVLQGCCNLIKYVKPYRITCYVLIGETTHKENLDRVSALYAMGIMPFVMPLNKYDSYQKKFARWVNHKAIFKSVAWRDYK